MMAPFVDPSVESKIAQKLGHASPFETAELDTITTLALRHARTLEGLERCRELQILIMTGCDVASVSDPLGKVLSLTALICRDSALAKIDGLINVPIGRMDFQRNRITDLTPLVDYSDLMRLDVTGNPLSEHSYRYVLRELRERGCDVSCSGKREWEINLRMHEMSLPFSYYLDTKGYRLCRPGMGLTNFPEIDHPIISPDDLEALLSRNPSGVSALFDQGR